MFDGERWLPDEVWITSIMTYWCESTIDTVLLMKRLYPKARIRVGGIYPTLAPHHLRHALESAGMLLRSFAVGTLAIEAHQQVSVVQNGDVIVTGEIPGASNAALDFECYREMTRALEGEERLPKYAILTTSRGCPFDCWYCAQKAYNEGSLKVRIRPAKDTFEEIRRQVPHVRYPRDRLLRGQLPSRKAKHRAAAAAAGGAQGRNAAPEAVRPGRRRSASAASGSRVREADAGQRLRRVSTCRLETMSRDVTRAWNRRHSHAGLFEGAVKICQDANFRLHDMEVNAFILFGMPDENLRDVVNTMFYASEMVGGLVPMLFTPVPGSIMFEQYEEYLFGEMGFDLHHLNGKLYPFLKYNNLKSGIRLADYVALESLAFRLNAKTMGQTFQLDGICRLPALRRVLAAHDGVACPPPVTADVDDVDAGDSRVALG